VGGQYPFDRIVICEFRVFLGFCGFQKIAGTQVRCLGPFIEPTPRIPRFLSDGGAATRIVALNPTFFAVFVRNRATSPFALFWSSCSTAIHFLCFLSSGGVGAKFFFHFSPAYLRESDCVVLNRATFPFSSQEQKEFVYPIEPTEPDGLHFAY